MGHHAVSSTLDLLNSFFVPSVFLSCTDEMEFCTHCLSLDVSPSPCALSSQLCAGMVKVLFSEFFISSYLDTLLISEVIGSSSGLRGCMQQRSCALTFNIFQRTRREALGLACPQTQQCIPWHYAGSQLGDSIKDTS